MSRKYNIEGIIIKRANLGEADKIITFFSKDRGKMVVLAKGIRRIHSRRSPHLELFNRVVLSLYQGKTWDIITEVYSLEVYQNVKNNLQRVALAYTLVEIIDLLCAEHVEQRKVYELLLSSFKNLNQVDNRVDNIDTELSKALLVELGFISEAQSKQNFDSFGYIESLAERTLKSRLFLKYLEKDLKKN